MAKPLLKFPRTLYRGDEDGTGTQTFTSKKKSYKYSSLVVNNGEEYDEALLMGYLDSYHDAVFGIPEEKKPKAPVKEL